MPGPHTAIVAEQALTDVKRRVLSPSPASTSGPQPTRPRVRTDPTRSAAEPARSQTPKQRPALDKKRAFPIHRRERGEDLFVHHSGIVGGGYHSLAEGAKVSFDLERGARGPKTVNVKAL